MIVFNYNSFISKEYFFSEFLSTTVNANPNYDVDWNVDILAGLSWDGQKIPDEFSKYLTDPQKTPNLPRHLDMKLPLLRDSDHLCYPIYSTFYFKFYNIDIISEQFMIFFRVPDIVRKKIFGKNRSDDFFRKRRNAVNKSAKDARLNSIILFPEEGNRNAIINNLSKAFGGAPKTNRFTIRLKEIKYEWLVNEWKDNYNMCRYTELYSNDINSTHYIFISSNNNYDRITKLLNRKYCNKSKIINAVLERLKEKKWRAGYGWIIQRLGPGINLSNSDLSILDFSYKDLPDYNEKLMYAFEVAGDIFGLAFLFDNRNMLSSIELIPFSKYNPRNHSRGMSTAEKRTLFNKYMEKVNNYYYPDKKIKYLKKAAKLFPKDPDLKKHKISRFTRHENIKSKKKFKVTAIVVDWKTGLEWAILPPLYNTKTLSEASWYQVNKWIKNLSDFNGGGWKFPTVYQLSLILTRDRNYVRYFMIPRIMGDGYRIWCSDKCSSDSEAINIDSRSSKQDPEKNCYSKTKKVINVNFMAVRPIRRELLKGEYRISKYGPFLSIN